VKRYRLKKEQTVFFPLHWGGNGFPTSAKDLLPGYSAISIKNMTRFDWFYGEEGGCVDIFLERGEPCIVLHIPYVLPYVEFLVAVSKDAVEEIPE
jgi:hypothetical protein